VNFFAIDKFKTHKVDALDLVWRGIACQHSEKGQYFGDEKERIEIWVHTQRHTHAYIRIVYHILEFLETDFAITILIGLHDRLVDNLLKLYILQVAADHHFQNDKQLSVRDVAVAVDIVHLESEM
jgi:hypothetical protein